jgi:hypothetical protein
MEHVRTLTPRNASAKNSAAADFCRTAIGIEFVAKPHFAQHVRALVPAAANAALADLAGFAGCALLVAEQEERLITFLTFWHGRLDSAAVAYNRRWVCKLIEPYMDRQLRIQTLRSQLAILPSEPVAPVAHVAAVADEVFFALRRAHVA